MVRPGDLGALRIVQVEYAQDWLATRVEQTGNKQAEWRTDPARSGPAGAVGDIGTHAFNLAEFITGDEVASLSADLHTFVEGRRLDDNAHMMLRFASGARGMLWCSQVAAGLENGLRIRVYGDRAGLEWHQENPNVLLFSPLGESPRLIRRNGAGTKEVSQAASRVPAGHPEGYLEGFAQLYTDVAEQIAARLEGRDPNAFSLQVPTVGCPFIAEKFGLGRPLTRPHPPCRIGRERVRLPCGTYSVTTFQDRFQQITARRTTRQRHSSRRAAPPPGPG